MDLNELLRRHQISLMCVEGASCAEARIAHQGLADLYEDQIREMRPTADGDSALTTGLFIAQA